MGDQKNLKKARTALGRFVHSHESEIIEAFLAQKTSISERYGEIPDSTIVESGKRYLELGGQGLEGGDMRPLYWAIKESVEERLAQGVNALEVIKATRLWRDIIVSHIRGKVEPAALEQVAVQELFHQFDDILGWIYGLTWESLLDRISGLSHYKTVVQSLHETVMILDTEGRIVFTNPHAEEVLGFRDEELRGRPIAEFMQGEPAAGKAGRYETSLRSREGEEIPVLASLVPLLEGDQPMGTLGVFTDLREQRRLADDARRAEHQLAAFLRTTNDAVVMLDDSGDVTLWNKGAELVFGYRPGEIVGRPFKALVTTDMLLEADAVVKKVRQGTHLRAYDMDLLTKEGMRITVSTTANQIPDARGAGVGFIFRDVTEKRRIEHELRDSRSELERAMVKLREHNIALEEDNVRLKQLLEIQPVVERPAPTDAQFTLHAKDCYLVRGDPEGAFRVFADLVTHGHQGLCITRSLPDRVRSRWGLEKTPIVWLTSNRVEGIHCIQPSGIAELSSTILSFIEKTDRGVVLIDGLEYLVSQNSFRTILHLVQLLNDKIMLSSASLILALDPVTLEERDLHVLQRDLVLLEPRVRGGASPAAGGAPTSEIGRA